MKRSNQFDGASQARPHAPSPTAATATLDVEEAYRTHRALLLSALGWLGRRGWLVQPSDAMGLVHDFFVEAWPGLRERYQPSKGALSTYLFGAFLRFARPRIARDLRWREGLVPLVEAIDDEVGDAPDDAGDLDAVRDALELLPAPDRALLEARVARGESERDLARRLGVSRHRLRASSAAALAKLAVRLDERGVIDRGDWPLARALFLDERSLEDAAAAVGMTVPQARSARQRILHTLARSLARGELEGAMPRRNTMSPDLCGMWRDLVAQPGDPEVAARAREHLEELLDHVDGCERCATAGEGAIDPAALYLALGTAEEELAPGEAALLEKMLAADAEDEAQVAVAVEDALLPSLSEKARSLYRAMSDAVPPRALFLATEAVGMMLRRFARTNRLDGKRFQIGHTGAVELDGVEIIPVRTVAAEIARLAHVERDVGERLASWIPLAARSQPRLVRGLVALPMARRSDAVYVSLADDDPREDLLRRWLPAEAHAKLVPPVDHERATQTVVAAKVRPVKPKRRR